MLSVPHASSVMRSLVLTLSNPAVLTHAFDTASVLAASVLTASVLTASVLTASVLTASAHIAPALTLTPLTPSAHTAFTPNALQQQGILADPLEWPDFVRALTTDMPACFRLRQAHPLALAAEHSLQQLRDRSPDMISRVQLGAGCVWQCSVTVRELRRDKSPACRAGAV